MKFSITKKDLKYQWFSGKGGGGQHRNKHQNCFRLHHIETGIIKTGQSNKSRHHNKREAFEAMAKDPKFLLFCDLKLRELEEGVTVEQKVNEWMSSENLRIETKDDEGRWHHVTGLL